MSKVRMDFARNDVTDRTFYCTDFSFFKDPNSADQPDREEVEINESDLATSNNVSKTRSH